MSRRKNQANKVAEYALILMQALKSITGIKMR
jgi:hypothetical protein